MASYSDNFDRADGEIGANWVEDNGDIDIVSNRANNQTAGAFNRARYASALDSADHYCEAGISSAESTVDGGVTCRQASSTQTYYTAAYIEQSNGTGYRLRKLVAGAETDLDTAASGAGEKVIKLTVNGATQSMEVADVEVCTGTDAVITSGAYAGMAGWANRASYNDWSAADLGGVASLSISVFDCVEARAILI